VKVLNALKEVRLAESDLWGSTGYGLDDFGREKLEKAYAYCFGAEASLVRPNISFWHSCSIPGSHEPGFSKKRRLLFPLVSL